MRGGTTNEEHVTFGFPIKIPTMNVQMKNSSSLVLPFFHRRVSHDPNALVFEFDILCHSYDCWNDAHKLKLFPSTLKHSTLHWFIGLGGDTIRTWDETWKLFHKKYQEYCKARELREESFQIEKKE